MMSETFENLRPRIPRIHPRVVLILVVVVVAVAGGLLIASGGQPDVVDMTLAPNPAGVSELVELSATVEGVPPGQSIVTADPNVKISQGFGWYDGALGADGFPIYAYIRRDYPNYGLWVTKCGDEGCTAGNVTNRVAPSAQRVGITVGADGLPVIMYDDYTASPRALRLVKCGDDSCSSGNTTMTVQDATGGYDAWSNYSGELGGDGLVAFSFHSVAGGWVTNSIELLHCDNVACSTFDVTIVDQANTGAYGASSNLAIGADGLPIMAYWLGSAGSPKYGVKVAKCGDATCSSSTITLVAGYKANVNWEIEIDVGSDGLPVLNYFYFRSMRVLKCGNAACSSGNAATLAVTTDNAYVQGTMGVGSDNLPVLVWADYDSPTKTYKWKLLKCGDTTCDPTAPGRTLTVLDQGQAGTYRAGYGPLFIRSDNRPIVSGAGGYDWTNPWTQIPRIRVADCLDAACNPRPGTTVTAVEYFIGATDPGEGGGTPMSAFDGAFDGQTEVATAVIDTLPLGEGSFDINVRGQDSTGGWSEILTETLVVGPLVHQPVDSGSGLTPVTNTYSGVTQGGSSSLTMDSTGPTPPAGFKLGSQSIYFDLTTAVEYSSVEVCINYTEAGLTYTREDRIRLYHYVGGVWVNATTSLDTVNDIICAEVSDLSLFAIFEEIPVPSVGEITAPLDPVQIGASVEASAGFTYDGNFNDLTAVWAWGDGATSPGSIVATPDTHVLGSHVYNEAGVNRLTLTVTSTEGTSGNNTFEFVVIYDPEGGFVTGGGWINSPAGAYAAAPDMTGKATFGFVSRYKKGATAPTGQTEFVFRVADLKFHSSNYDWLVVAGARAQYKGTGTINGEGNYKFLLTAIDSEVAGGGDADKFRIKIWEVGGGVVYDNQPGGKDDADLTTVLGGGNIRIHKAKK